MKSLWMFVVAAVAFGGAVNLFANGLETPVSFAAAEAVWPEGLDRQMNVQVAFRAPLDLSESDRPVLKVAAWYTYRITLNGRFVAFGPIRSPKGFARADELDLSAAAQQGRNDLVVEVAGYNVPNYYLMEQPPFLKAEVVLDGRVIAATRVRDGGFCAVRAPRVQKVPRYSFQRTFTEHYRLPGPSASPMPLAKAREPVLIPRRAAYPAYETSALMPLSVADVRVDATLPVVEDRSLTLPSRKGWFKGFEIKDLELNLSRLGQNLAYAGRRSMWFALQCGEYLQRTGDRTMIDALRPKLEKLVAYLRGFRNADGLLEKLPGWVFVDWSHSNALVQDVNYPSNMTWAEVLETMDRLYGKPELAAGVEVRSPALMMRFCRDEAACRIEKAIGPCVASVSGTGILSRSVLSRAIDVTPPNGRDARSTRKPPCCSHPIA